MEIAPAVITLANSTRVEGEVAVIRRDSKLAYSWASGFG
jgi:hypothetical protein